MSDQHDITNRSEVARLMQLIDLELEAARQGMNGLAAVGTHASITKRMETIGGYKEELDEVIGNDQSTRLVYQLYELRIDKNVARQEGESV